MYTTTIYPIPRLPPYKLHTTVRASPSGVVEHNKFSEEIATVDVSSLAGTATVPADVCHVVKTQHSSGSILACAESFLISECAVILSSVSDDPIHTSLAALSLTTPLTSSSIGVEASSSPAARGTGKNRRRSRKKKSPANDLH